MMTSLPDETKSLIMSCCCCRGRWVYQSRGRGFWSDFTLERPIRIENESASFWIGSKAYIRVYILGISYDIVQKSGGISHALCLSGKKLLSRQHVPWRCVVEVPAAGGAAGAKHWNLPGCKLPKLSAMYAMNDTESSLEHLMIFRITPPLLNHMTSWI